MLYKYNSGLVTDLTPFLIESDFLGHSMVRKVI